jgi:hypothetical protein
MVLWCNQRYRNGDVLSHCDSYGRIILEGRQGDNWVSYLLVGH